MTIELAIAGILAQNSRQPEKSLLQFLTTLAPAITRLNNFCNFRYKIKIYVMVEA